MGKNILVGSRWSLVFVYAQSRLGNSDMFLASGSAKARLVREGAGSDVDACSGRGEHHIFMRLVARGALHSTQQLTFSRMKGAARPNNFMACYRYVPNNANGPPITTGSSSAEELHQWETFWLKYWYPRSMRP